MTIAKPYYPPFVHVEPTKENIPFVELGVVDLSKYVEGPEGLEVRKQLAAELEEAVTTQGFFFLEGHGYPKSKLDYLQAVSQAILDLPLEEKERYSAGSAQSDADAIDDGKKLGAERGSGFKQRGYWAMQNGVRDAIEHIKYRDLLHPTLRNKHSYPPLVQQHLPEIAEYFSFLHLNVVRKLASLFDIILELPEGTVWNLFEVHEDQPELSGGGFGRAMLYHGMSASDEAKTNNTWLRGHSDASALTFITSQPMASLQFRDYHDGEWKYVGYRPNALVLNIGDRFEFLTGGWAKSTIHRVVSPPKDQRGHRRLGVIYFCDIKPSVYIDPDTLQSPKLARLGYKKPEEWERITGEQWDDQKAKSFGKAYINLPPGDEPAPFYIYGRLAERWHQLGK
ncbi:hypothetical protein RTG_01057 [Rhodotorula toruloides ATCC 204091]|uniref:Clavaminate synthase-like protein n=1 Tax=Rhodotorula toruloides TaxID=5286 RepID=A0A0K3CE50_RHOTO|nr:hypothetical protein RTG_01057 [Rhodotorula toruloides ATCC 204091]KAK4334589.1 hypothetical protein RTBOTA2_003342 [Rhodotorula toruloides]PRQ75436.1 hypothetical protein AAT19DRAFT_14458 [Rhodotorula toruloides]